MNRRTVLSGSALLPLAVVAPATPLAAATAMERMQHHGKALSEALAEWNREFPTDDVWIAEIHPGGTLALTSETARRGHVPASPIGDLFRQFVAAYQTDTSSMADGGLVPLYDEYRRLQEEIIAAVPTSPRDVAIQFICDTDFGWSTNSAAFEASMYALAGIERVQS